MEASLSLQHLEFEEIDRVFAKRMLRDFAKASEEEAFFISSLMKMSRQGHLCMELDDRLRKGAEALDESLVEALDESGAIPKKPFCRFKDRFYLQKNWVYETRFLFHVRRLKEALTLITGGPGTGKTYQAAQIVTASFKEDLEIVLAAPTGKAAAHLEAGVLKALGKKENVRCGTLHQILGIRSPLDFTNENPYLSADLILVDECSMIDARLFSFFLSAVKEGARLILMGDPDQLPPVESGSLFADLVEAQVDFNHIHLEKSMRSDKKEILELAQAVKEGEILKVLPFITPLEEQETLIQKIKAEFSYATSDPEELLKAFDRFRVLSCVRQGSHGVDTLNEILAKTCKNIPILITRNDYDLQLYNGDTGVLIKDTAYFWDKQGKIRKIGAHALPRYEYAFCLSVHKSQGSEYDRILFLIPSGSEQFGKEVLYTAITRARSSCTIQGSEEIVRETLLQSSRKKSSIKERLG